MTHALQSERVLMTVIKDLTNRAIDGAGAPTPIHLDFTPTTSQQKLFAAYVVEKAILHVAMGPFTTGLQCISQAWCYDPVLPTTTLSNAGMILNHNDGDVMTLTTARPTESFTVNKPAHPILGAVFDSVTGITQSREPVRIDQTWNCGHFYFQPLESNVQYVDTWVEYVVTFIRPRVDG